MRLFQQPARMYPRQPSTDKLRGDYSAAINDNARCIALACATNRNWIYLTGVSHLINDPAVI
jgi:hypothetical protein